MSARKPHVSRRRFLQGSAALAAGAGLGQTKAVAAANVTAWRQTVDVLMAGVNATGACAALTARRLGANVPANARPQVQFQWNPVHAEYPNLASIHAVRGASVDTGRSA